MGQLACGIFASAFCIFPLKQSTHYTLTMHKRTICMCAIANFCFSFIKSDQLLLSTGIFKATMSGRLFTLYACKLTADGPRA